MVSRDEVLRVAKLARIELRDEDLETTRQKFSAVLEHFKFLGDAPTEGVEPVFHAAEKMELRDDVPEAALDRNDLLKNAPEQVDNCFKLPRVVGSAP